MFFLGFGRFMYHNPNIFLFWALCVTLIKHLLSRLLFMVRITKNSYPTERDKYPMYHTPALKLSHCHVDETPLILSALYGMQTIITQISNSWWISHLQGQKKNLTPALKSSSVNIPILPIPCRRPLYEGICCQYLVFIMRFRLAPIKIITS